MPRRTPVTELQNEEPAPASPLRRSSRLSTVNSPAPTKVITRRNSATELSTATTTPKATRGRRSSFSQALEVEDDKKKLALAKTKSSSENGTGPHKLRTRASSVPKEPETKRNTRRSVSEDKEIKIEEPQSAKKVTRGRTKKSDSESDVKAVTPFKISPTGRGVEPMESIEETKDEQEFEIAASSETSLKKKPDVSKVDLELSVIQETSLTEEDMSPQKKSSDKSVEEKPAKPDQPEEKENSDVDKPQKESTAEVQDVNETQRDDEQSDLNKSSVKENNVSNKENISPNAQDESEPMEVDEPIEEQLEKTKKSTDDVAESLNSLVKQLTDITEKQVEDVDTQQSEAVKEKESSESNNQTEEEVKEEEAEKQANEADEEETQEKEAKISNVEATDEANKTAEKSLVEEKETMVETTDKVEEKTIEKSQEGQEENKDTINEEQIERVVSPSEEICLTLEDDDYYSPTQKKCTTFEENDELVTNVTEVSPQSKKTQDVPVVVVDDLSAPTETVDTTVEETNEPVSELNETEDDKRIEDVVVEVKEETSEILEESMAVRSESSESIEVLERSASSKESDGSIITVEEEVVTIIKSHKVNSLETEPKENNSSNQDEDKKEKEPKQSDMVDKDESSATENDSYKSPAKKIRSSVYSISDDEVFTYDADVNVADLIKSESKVNGDINKEIANTEEEERVANGGEEEVIPENIKESDFRRSLVKHPLEEKTLITLKDTIKAGENREGRLSDRIHKVVDLFCSGIKNEADVSVNVSFEYTGQTSEAEDISDKTDLVEISFSADVLESKIEPQKGSKRRKICPEENQDEGAQGKPSPKKRKSEEGVEEDAAVKTPNKRMSIKKPDEMKEVKMSPREKPSKSPRRKSLSNVAEALEVSLNEEAKKNKSPERAKGQHEDEHMSDASPKNKKRKSDASLESPKAELADKNSPFKKQKLATPNQKSTGNTPKKVTVTASPMKKQKKSGNKLEESQEDVSSEGETGKQEEEEEETASTIEEEEDDGESDDSEVSAETNYATLYKRLLSTSFDQNDEDMSWRPDTDSSMLLSDESSDDSYEPSEDEDEAAESDQKSANENKNVEGAANQSEQKSPEKESSPKTNKLRKIFRLSTFDVNSALDKNVQKTPAPERKVKEQNEKIVPSKNVKGRKNKKQMQGFFVESENVENILPETSELAKENKKKRPKQTVEKKNDKQAKIKGGSKTGTQVFKPSLGDNTVSETFSLKPSTETSSGWRVTKM